MSVPRGPWASSFLGPPAATPFPGDLGVQFPACWPLLESCLLSLRTLACLEAGATSLLLLLLSVALAWRPGPARCCCPWGERPPSGSRAPSTPPPVLLVSEPPLGFPGDRTRRSAKGGLCAHWPTRRSRAALRGDTWLSWLGASPGRGRFVSYARHVSSERAGRGRPPCCSLSGSAQTPCGGHRVTGMMAGALGSRHTPCLWGQVLQEPGAPSTGRVWGPPSAAPGSGHARPVTGSPRPTDGPSRPRWPSDPREAPGFLGGPPGGDGESVGRPCAWSPGRCGRRRGAPGRVVGTALSRRAWGETALCPPRPVRPDLARVLETRASQPMTLEQ